ncbi:uncharacterized protein LOC124168677 [Ischnura elegans]|uniref:uncharacterized protein LOC124168677 n=1 Tax=Ischnura elegans TaxID=197161 RepID=UPI001ED893D1|nr:uncharacterized protein LOC124168677 [Ischnura elegans]
MISRVVELPELKRVLEFYEGLGYDLYRYVNYVLDLLAIPPLAYKTLKASDSSRSGVMGMFDDIVDTLPLDNMYEWYKTRCEPDPEFQDLLKRLRSQEFQVIVNTVRSDPAFTKMLEHLEKMRVNMDPLREFCRSYLRW